MDEKAVRVSTGESKLQRERGLITKDIGPLKTDYERGPIAARV